jgi:hypothetical protein
MDPPGDETLRYPVMEVGVAIVAGAGLATVFEAPRPNTSRGLLLMTGSRREFYDRL